jgi:hypothetical protein
MVEDYIPKEIAMPILNYTTTIDIHKTLGEVQGLLVRKGARSIMINYDSAGNPISLSFLIKTLQSEFPVRLPADPDAVLKVMQRQHSRSGLVNREQAFRVAWRIIKDWVEAQMAIIETEQVRMEQVFLPYIETASGKTVYQLFQEKQEFLLAEGKRES